jgi:hypothetical protein
MIALSSLHFCPCDGRQAGLWYLPARWRYTTELETIEQVYVAVQRGGIAVLRILLSSGQIQAFFRPSPSRDR